MGSVESGVLEAPFWCRLPEMVLPRTRWGEAMSSHRTVMNLFAENLPGPSREKRSTAGVLFRRDIVGGVPMILVQSIAEPVRLPAGADVRRLTGSQWNIPEGMQVQFRVTVHMMSRRGGVEKFVPMHEQHGWLMQRLRGALNDVVELNRIPGGVMAAGGRVLPSVTFDGVGVVSSSSRFMELRLGGVGRSKSYGFGLLTALRSG